MKPASSPSPPPSCRCALERVYARMPRNDRPQGTKFDRLLGVLIKAWAGPAPGSCRRVQPTSPKSATPVAAVGSIIPRLYPHGECPVHSPSPPPRVVDSSRGRGPSWRGVCSSSGGGTSNAPLHHPGRRECRTVPEGTDRALRRPERRGTLQRHHLRATVGHEPQAEAPIAQGAGGQGRG